MLLHSRKLTFRKCFRWTLYARNIFHSRRYFFLNDTMASDLYLIYGSIQCIIQSTCIIANLLTIIGFANIPNLRKNTSNILIYALSITDFFCGIYQLSYRGLPMMLGLGPPLAETGCKLIRPLEYVYSAGNYILVVISIDRVLLVSMDYSKYNKTVTKLRLKVTIGICFLISFLASLFDLSLWNYAKRNNANAASINFEEACRSPPKRMKWFGIYTSVSFYLLPLLLICIFSVIFVNRLLARINKGRRIGNVPTDASSNTGNASANESGQGTAGVKNDGGSKKRYMKSAVTLAALVSAMAISMLPYCTYLLVVAISGSFSSDLTTIMYLVLQLNPMLDPIFYAATQKSIREYYGNKIRSLLRSFRNPDV